MQGTISEVDGNPRQTKTGKTYYRVQLMGGQWISVYNQYAVGDILTFDEGRIPGWPLNVKKVGSDETTTPPPSKKLFGPTEYETLLATVVAIAKRQGITDHQAIVRLHDTLIISLQKRGIHVDVESFVF